MQSLTFMAAKLGRLCKTVRPAGVEPYPMAKQFKSHIEAVASPDQFLQALRTHAAAGHCLHVGDLSQQLDNWGSRAGLADRGSTLRWAVIDVDRLDLGSTPQQWDTDSLQSVAEYVIDQLNDPALRDVTYIAQAATKLGLTGNRASLHLFFLLETAVHAAELKRWLKQLNFRSDQLRRNIRLSANGFAFLYPVDVTCADIGRLIYLAPPIFIDVPDPFASPDDRFVLVRKRYDRLDVTGTVVRDDLNFADAMTRQQQAAQLSALDLDQIERRLKRELRAAAGLNPNERERIQTLNLSGRHIELLTNPNRGSLRPAYNARGFCYYNLNDGDSAAYFHEAGKPDIIHNFKGEPSFRWADVDPDSYEAYCQSNAQLIAEAEPINTFMVINQDDDKIYKVWHHHADDRVTVVTSSRQQVEDFYAEYGKVPPPYLPTWRIQFAPDAPRRVDYVGRTINLFNPTEYMKNPSHDLGNVAEMLKLGAYELWATLCPAINTLINHVSGNAPQPEQDLFINWLAFIFQRRKKAKTAWVFQGEEGTGKGSLFTEVLRPIFGLNNVVMKHMDVLTDTFDAWRSRALIVALDEFEMPASDSGDRNLARLRGWISEENNGVRNMHKLSEDTPLYESYILFSNKHNILRIPEGDRRYCIFPRQEKKLREICDTVQLYEQIAGELELFAAVLHNWQVDENKVMMAYNNEAKVIARAAAYTTSDEFALSVKHGKLDYFTEVFNVTPTPHNIANHQLARAAVSRAVLHVDENIFVSATEMAAIYNTLNDAKLNPMHFSKMMARHGVPTVRSRLDGRQQRGFAITFRAEPEEVESLQAYVRRQLEGNQFSVVEGGRA